MKERYFVVVNDTKEEIYFASKKPISGTTFYKNDLPKI